MASLGIQQQSLNNFEQIRSANIGILVYNNVDRRPSKISSSLNIILIP